MSSSSLAGANRTLPIYTTVLAWFFVAACAAMALYLPLFDRANWELMGSAFYLVAAGLVAAGLLALRRGSPRLAVTAASAN